MTYDNIEDFHPNIQKKVQSDNYDLEKDLRLKPRTELRGAKIEKIRKDLRKRRGRDGNQALLEYILELGWTKFKELKLDPDQQLEDHSKTRE